MIIYCIWTDTDRTQQTLILFIDADEFVTHESMEDGAEIKHLTILFNDESVGMVGINWRTFGSSGHKNTSNDLIIERLLEVKLVLETRKLQGGENE